MSNALNYKGYSARVEYDDDDGIFFGRIAGIRDGLGFHADTVADLKAAFREAVEDYLEACAKLGREAQKPYSGNLMLRVDPEVHSKAAIAAELAGKSLNQWSEDVLAKAADEQATSGASALRQSRHQFHEVAGHMPVVELRPQDSLPRIPARAA